MPEAFLVRCLGVHAAIHLEPAGIIFMAQILTVDFYTLNHNIDRGNHANGLGAYPLAHARYCGASGHNRRRRNSDHSISFQHSDSYDNMYQNVAAVEASAVNFRRNPGKFPRQEKHRLDSVAIIKDGKPVTATPARRTRLPARRRRGGQRVRQTMEPRNRWNAQAAGLLFLAAGFLRQFEKPLVSVPNALEQDADEGATECGLEFRASAAQPGCGKFDQHQR